MRYFIHLAYDGSGYCGWQVQPNGDTVQGKLNFFLSKLLNQHVSSMGCGRTDSGVHATDFYAHFDTETILDEKFIYKLNAVLPADICVYDIFEVDRRCHTRFDATEREYEYHIHFEKIPFIRQYSAQIYPQSLDWDKIFEATAMLTSFQDFTSLCRPSEDFSSNICDLKLAQWETGQVPFLVGHNFVGNKLGGNWNKSMKLRIRSNRFLRGMIRKIVGTMMLIGRGKISIDEFQSVVSQQQDFRKVSLAPPQGLYLTEVVYPYLEGK